MRPEAQGDDDEDGETEGDLDSDAKRVLSNIRAIARRRRTAPALGGGGGAPWLLRRRVKASGCMRGAAGIDFPQKQIAASAWMSSAVDA